MHILVIEDNRDLSATLCEYLADRAHVLDAAGDGISGLRLAAEGNYDAIVLDVMLPRLDGLSLCQKLRKESRKSTPILMLTARDTLEDKLKGFEVGADDYLVKPFSLQELEARLQVLGRRMRSLQQNVLQVSDLTLDLDSLEARRDGHALPLTPMGIRLLTLLMRQSPGVVTKREIEIAIWGDDPPDSDALRTHIHALRNAIDKPFKSKLLHTVHSTGYRLASGDES